MLPIEKIRELRNKKKLVYIYGAGIYGQTVYKILKSNHIAVDGFVVSKRADEFPTELPIYEAQTVLEPDAGVGVIIGVNNPDSVRGVKEVLEFLRFDMDDIVSEHDFCLAQNVDPKDDNTGFPTIEITTKIGCGINCRFCPQDSFIEAYFKGNSKRDKIMGMEVFSRCLEKLPSNCLVNFCGFVEPMLNPDCVEMIKLACQSGRPVDLYTTLVGATDDMINQICEIPFRFMTLHVADRHGYANIPTSDQYYKNVEKVVNCRKKDGTPLIDVCNAQTDPDERVLEICAGKYDILTVMHDRAGNLSDDELFKKEYPTGPILCGTVRKPRSNVLLPDGTLVLCCMDFGMKHILGNLLESSYDEIINGYEMRRVEQGMADSKSDILCRKCFFANSAIK